MLKYILLTAWGLIYSSEPNGTETQPWAACQSCTACRHCCTGPCPWAPSFRRGLGRGNMAQGPSTTPRMAVGSSWQLELQPHYATLWGGWHLPPKKSWSYTIFSRFIPLLGIYLYKRKPCWVACPSGRQMGLDLHPFVMETRSECLRETVPSLQLLTLWAWLYYLKIHSSALAHFHITVLNLNERVIQETGQHILGINRKFHMPNFE